MASTVVEGHVVELAEAHTALSHVQALAGGRPPLAEPAGVVVVGVDAHQVQGVWRFWLASGAIPSGSPL